MTSFNKIVGVVTGKQEPSKHITHTNFHFRIPASMAHAIKDGSHN